MLPHIFYFRDSFINLTGYFQNGIGLIEKGHFLPDTNSGINFPVGKFVSEDVPKIKLTSTSTNDLK